MTAAGPNGFRPRFMGPEHVARMNELLDGALRDECGGLEGEHQIHYEISDDPEGIRSWTLAVGPRGMRFDLNREPDNPVAVVRDSYSSQAAAAQITREGGEPTQEPEYEIHDPDAFARVAAVVAASRAIATVDVIFPDAR